MTNQTFEVKASEWHARMLVAERAVREANDALWGDPDGGTVSLREGIERLNDRCREVYQEGYDAAMNAAKEANAPDMRDEAAALTDAEQKAQGARCGCKGVDDYCVCQNVPDSTTRKERAMRPANEDDADAILTEIAEENEAMREDEFNALGPGDDE
jgi:hypothetical protein